MTLQMTTVFVNAPALLVLQSWERSAWQLFLVKC